MEDVKLNITVPEHFDQSKPIMVELREGSAPDIRTRNNHKIAGTIGSIVEFVSKRVFSAEPKDNPEIVTFSIDPDNAYIKLIADPHDDLGSKYEVSTKLVYNRDFLDFHINQEPSFTQPSLVQFVMKHAHCFINTEFARTLLNSLRNFQAKFTTEVKKADDRQGNTEDSVKTAIEFAVGALPKQIEIFVPIYKNTAPVKLLLDVEVEKRGNAASFGFYCLELQNVLDNAAAKLIIEQVDKLKGTFVTIEQ